RQCAGEGAEAALLAVPDALLQRRRLALALDGQLVAAGDVDLKVLQVQPRQLGLDEYRVAVLPDVDGRERRGQAEHPAAVLAPALEDPVHLPLELLQFVPDGAKRLPTR